MPLEAAPLLTYNNTLLTSIAVTSTHDYTVAFLGTSNGHIKKAVVESVTSAFEYDSMVIDEGSSVNSDMHFASQNKNYLYVMTRNKVTMVKVQECHVYKSCHECLGARDPYCGWCSLEDKCSLRSECEAAQAPKYWLSYKNGKCTTISQVHPPQIQRTTTRTLTLMIDNLPVLDTTEYYCEFTAFGKSRITNATRSSNGVMCPTPPTDTLPQIPAGARKFAFFAFSQINFFLKNLKK